MKEMTDESKGYEELPVELETSDDDLSTVDSDESCSEDELCEQDSERSSEWSGSEFKDPLGTRLRHELKCLRSLFGSSGAPHTVDRIRREWHIGKGEPIERQGTAPDWLRNGTKNRSASKAKDTGTKVERDPLEVVKGQSNRRRPSDAIPNTLTVNVNRRACQALLDSGARSNFISRTLFDDLDLERRPLLRERSLEMAVKGLKSEIHAQTIVDFACSTIHCRKMFDTINIANYDMILGMPFFEDHDEAQMEMLVAAAPCQNPFQGKGALLELQKSNTDSERLPQSDTSDSEMRVTRGGGDNRSSVPENTMNPHDSPQERRTIVAPATRKAAGKTTHALNPAKSDKHPLVEDSKSEM